MASLRLVAQTARDIAKMLDYGNEFPEITEDEKELAPLYFRDILDALETLSSSIRNLISQGTLGLREPVGDRPKAPQITTRVEAENLLDSLLETSRQNGDGDEYLKLCALKEAIIAEVA